MFKKRSPSPSLKDGPEPKAEMVGVERSAGEQQPDTTAQQRAESRLLNRRETGRASKLINARRKRTKQSAPMIGDPEYEKLFREDTSAHTVNPVKWLINRKEKKQQEACRMEWQDFEIDRLKCENEILQIRDMKNERDRETLNQEIYDYKNCLAIAHVRLRKTYKELRITFESLKQVHEWVPEGEDDPTFIDIPELDDYGEDKEQLTGLVADMGMFVDKLKHYTEELFQRSATKYFASRGVVSRTSVGTAGRRDSDLSPARRKSLSPDTGRAGYWLSDFHIPENKIHSQHDAAPVQQRPWWKRSIETRSVDTPSLDSDTDLTLARDGPVKPAVRRSSSLNPYDVRDLPSAMAMMAFSQDELATMHANRHAESLDNVGSPTRGLAHGTVHVPVHKRHSIGQEHYAHHRRLSHQHRRSHSVGGQSSSLLGDSVPQIVVSDQVLLPKPPDTPPSSDSAALVNKVTDESLGEEQSESDSSAVTHVLHRSKKAAAPALGLHQGVKPDLEDAIANVRARPGPGPGPGPGKERSAVPEQKTHNGKDGDDAKDGKDGKDQTANSDKTQQEKRNNVTDADGRKAEKDAGLGGADKDTDRKPAPRDPDIVASNKAPAEKKRAGEATGTGSKPVSGAGKSLMVRAEEEGMENSSSCSLGEVMCSSVPDAVCTLQPTPAPVPSSSMTDNRTPQHLPPAPQQDIRTPRHHPAPHPNANDLFVVLQQTEREVHMLRKEKEELLKQLDVAQNMLDLLSMEVEAHKKEVAELKDRCRKAKAILG